MSEPFVSVKVWYPVGMVDTSTLAGVLRASNQRRTPAGEPPNQERTQREEESPLDRWAQNYASTDQRRVDDTVQYGGPNSGLGSRIADALVSRNVVEDSVPFRAGAIATDFIVDPANLIGIPGVGAGARAGVQAATNPTVQARTNAMLGRLYHGNRNPDKPWSVAQSRPYEDRQGNWFGGDLFGTTDMGLASSYGPDSLYRLGNLPSNLKVLDLMPGGRTVAQQSPELAEALSKIVSGNFDDVTDFARHTSLTSLPDDQLYQLMQQYGFNSLRHISGQGIAGGSGRAKPVYQFFDPEGITANSVGPVNRALYNTGEVLSDIPGAVQNTARNVGNRFVDSVDDAVRQSGSSNPRVQEFLSERGNVVPGFASSTGSPRRLSVDPDTGRTITNAYNPYPAVSGAISALAKPAQVVRNARQATINAYQKRLDEYAALERANRQNFMQNYQNTSGLPSGGNLPGAPMPPGYSPLPEPSGPGAFDFLRGVFSQ